MFSTVVSIFPPPLCPSPPTTNSHPQYFPSLDLSMGPLYMFVHDPSTSFSCYPPNPSLLITVSLFFISTSLVIFCLLICFVDYVPLKDHMIFFFHCLAYFTYIMLSVPSMRSRRVRSPSMLFLCSIPLCKCTMVLIHSFTDGHLVCYQHLAIVNCATYLFII